MNQFKHLLLFIFAILPILIKSQNCGINLIQAPISSTRCSGDTLTLFVNYTGQNLSYQWRKNGSNIPNATNPRLDFASVTTADNGTYDVVVSANGCPSQTSPSATVSVKEAPPAPYVGELNGFCGCESVTGKAQHRDAFFQPIPNLTFVWYDNIKRQGNPLPSVMDGNISLHTSFRNNTVYAFELANGCYSPPSRLDLTVFNLPNRTPKVFRGNSTEELPDFVPISSCDPITLNAVPSVPNGRVSWYKSSNRSQLISVGNTLVCDTSQTVFAFDEPENNACSGSLNETLQCFGKPKEIRIIILPKPIVSLGADLVLCDSNASKTITATVNGNNITLNYTWSTGANTPSIVVNTANTYSVTVTNNDFFRCSGTDEVVVSSSNFSINLNKDQTVCGNNTTTLTVTTSGGKAPFSYLWNNGQTTPSVNVDVGTYQVTVTDANGCTKVAASKVLQSNSLTVSLGDDKSVCGANTTVLTATVSGGTVPYAYVWSNGQNTPSVNVSVGTYQVTVTDSNGCSGSDQVVVTQSNSLTVSLGDDKSVCGVNTTVLTATVSGGTVPYAYVWSNGQNTPSVNVSVGTYQVTVTDSNGCSGSDQVVVTQSNSLTVSLGDDKSVCGANTTVLTATISGGTVPYAYVWSNGQSTPSVNVGVGTYQVTVTDSNGCSGSDQVVVTQSNSLTVSLGDDKSVCGANTTVLTATVSGGTVPYAYVWSNGQSTPSVNVSVGTYQVTVTDSNGCSGSDEVRVATGGSGNIQVSIEQKNNFCYAANDGAIFITAQTGQAPFSYSINNGVNWSNSPYFFNLKSGDYMVVVKESGGCSFSQVVRITEPKDIKFTVTAQASCHSSNLKVENVTGGTGHFYQFSINYGISWQSGNVFNNLAHTTYYVRVRDSFGCISDTRSVNLQPQNILFTVNNIDGNCEKGGTVKIENISGGIAPYQYSADGGNVWQTTAIFTNLSTGIYALRVRDAALCQSNSQLVSVKGGSFNIQIDQTNNLCAGSTDGSIYINSLGGVAPYQYSIDNGLKWYGNPHFTNLASGSYTIKVKDALGCVTSKSITITEPPTLKFTATSQNVGCEGASDGRILFSSVSGGSGSNYQYSIDFGLSFQNANVFKNLSAGIYNVRIKDGLGCLSATKQVEISTFSPISFQTSVYNGTCNANSNGIISVTNITGGNAPYKYSRNGGIAFQNSNAFFFLSAGSYPIRVKDAKGCQSTVQNVTIVKNCGTASIALNSKPVQGIPVVIYGLSPNPTTDFIHIELNSLDKREVYFEFFDALGRLILTEKRVIELGVQKVEFDVSNFSQGIYQVYVKDSYARNIPNRFVKQ